MGKVPRLTRLRIRKKLRIEEKPFFHRKKGFSSVTSPSGLRLYEGRGGMPVNDSEIIELYFPRDEGAVDATARK